MCLTYIAGTCIVFVTPDAHNGIEKGVLHSGSASVSHTEGRGFDSLHLHLCSTHLYNYIIGQHIIKSVLLYILQIQNSRMVGGCAWRKFCHAQHIF